MKTHQLHPWNVSVEQARAIQKNLSAWVVTEGRCRSPRLLGRIEMACTHENHNLATVQASVSIRALPSLQLLERKVSIRTSEFPAVEGLASFRKVPAVVAALAKLVRVPDVIICDGRGRTGSNSFGVASHVGLITNLPTIGIRAPRPRLLSDLLGNTRGCWLPVIDGGVEAVLLRVIEGLDPLMVSPAHRIDLEDAMRQVLKFVPANTPAQEYLQLLYPEAGIRGKLTTPLTLVSSRRPA